MASSFSHDLRPNTVLRSTGLDAFSRHHDDAVVGLSHAVDDEVRLVPGVAGKHIVGNAIACRSPIQRCRYLMCESEKTEKHYVKTHCCLGKTGNSIVCLYRRHRHHGRSVELFRTCTASEQIDLTATEADSTTSVVVSSTSDSLWKSSNDLSLNFAHPMLQYQHANNQQINYK